MGVLPQQARRPAAPSRPLPARSSPSRCPPTTHPPRTRHAPTCYVEELVDTTVPSTAQLGHVQGRTFAWASCEKASSSRHPLPAGHDLRGARPPHTRRAHAMPPLATARSWWVPPCRLRRNWGTCRGELLRERRARGRRRAVTGEESERERSLPAHHTHAAPTPCPHLLQRGARGCHRAVYGVTGAGEGGKFCVGDV